ncbi:MAG: NAD-dependent malic enzyme [Armatimonadota bacterium]
MPEHETIDRSRYRDLLLRRLTVRLLDVPGGFGRFADAVGSTGALIGDIRRVRIEDEHVVRDVDVHVRDRDHLNALVARVSSLENVEVLRVLDHVLEMHLGGKLEVVSRVPLETVSDLLTVYTPGVAQVCQTIADDATKAYTYTHIWNTVAIVTNGTAVLGLGDIGPVAGMPVMEGKGVILRRMVDISPVPILIDSRDPDVIVEVVSHIAPTFGAVQLEDIAAPECFQIEAELSRRLDRVVFHDDQHGTAIVVTAALMTALDRLERDLSDLKVVVNGAGAAGIAITRMLQGAGARNVILCDRAGALYEGRSEHMNAAKEEIAATTNPANEAGSLSDVLRGAHVFVGVSAPDLVTPEMVAGMAPQPVVYALANPVPEIDKRLALAAGAAFATDGRTLNNALAFPGVFRGCLDARAKAITPEMKLAASRAIARQTPSSDLVPNFMDREMHRHVAAAVQQAAIEAGAARTRVPDPGTFERHHTPNEMLAGGRANGDVIEQ